MALRAKQLLKRAFRGLGWDPRRYRPGSSEDAYLAAMLRFLDTDVVLDVGANAGQYAQRLRSLGYRRNIVSFEPLSEAHARLRKNAAKDPRWFVEERVAVGAYESIVDVNVAANDGLSSSVMEMAPAHLRAAPESHYVGTESVRMARLDLLSARTAANHRSLFLKLDVQGYEAEVLQGATGILARIQGLQVELSFVELYRGQHLFFEMAEAIQRLGFTFAGIFPVLVDPVTASFLQVDGYFVRRRDGEPE